MITMRFGIMFAMISLVFISCVSRNDDNSKTNIMRVRELVQICDEVIDAPIHESQKRSAVGGIPKDEVRQILCSFILNGNAPLTGCLNAMADFNSPEVLDILIQRMAQEKHPNKRSRIAFHIEHFRAEFLEKSLLLSSSVPEESNLTILSASGFQGQEMENITVEIPTLPENRVPLTLIKIPAGSFQKGSPLAGWYLANELPQHRIEMSEFYIGQYEFTVDQWLALMGDVPSGSDVTVGRDDAMTGVSWYDINAENGLMERLNALGVGRFRLPSEAEWEYACRSGTQTDFWFRDLPKAKESLTLEAFEEFRNYLTWYWNFNTTKTVGRTIPNPLGLYDMHGNVWEWCQDKYFSSYIGAPQNQPAWEGVGGLGRVLRGGGYDVDLFFCRSASRIAGDPSLRLPFNGFRVVMEATKK